MFPTLIKAFLPKNYHIDHLIFLLKPKEMVIFLNEVSVKTEERDTFSPLINSWKTCWCFQKARKYKFHLFLLESKSETSRGEVLTGIDEPVRLNDKILISVEHLILLFVTPVLGGMNSLCCKFKGQKHTSPKNEFLR